eukprot:m.151079 g.151079  ORF g.151079 m.151079 type:complete len:77 (+) comp17849_c0_seq5:161-391(+)
MNYIDTSIAIPGTTYVMKTVPAGAMQLNINTLVDSPSVGTYSRHQLHLLDQSRIADSRGYIPRKVSWMYTKLFEST